jgi:hypothetical protein
MAKKSKNKRKPTRAATGKQSPAQKPVSEPKDVTDKIDEINEKALEGAIEDDIANIPEASKPDKIDLQKEYEKAHEACELFQRQKERADKAEEEANDREKEWQSKIQELRGREEALSQKTQELTDQENEYEEKLERFEEERNTLQEQEITLRERESNAELGFEKERQEVTRNKENELQAIREEIVNLRQKKLEDQSKWDEESQKKVDELSKDIAERRSQEESRLAGEREVLEGKQREVEERGRELEREKRRLEWDKESLDELKEDLERRVEQRAAAKIEDLESENRALQERLEVAREGRDDLEKTLDQREEADRRFGHKSPDEIMAELQTQKQEIGRLEDKLSSRPGEEAVERLRDLEGEKEEWGSEQIALRQELQSSKRRVEKYQIAVTELESLRDHKAALMSSNELLKVANNELRKDIDERLDRVDATSPFPACSEMDENSELQMEVASTAEVSSLKAFAGYLQQAMACDPNTGKELYYSNRDVRSFLGGLAMSRLHLLQGISGTGKTSLPLAFARAIGAGCELIETQAGWRDRNDLIGYFNAFEGRYYESEFLQALYMAQCPRYEDLMFIIVLDEMNLSHPEQYFADFLSVLEQDQHLQDIDLVSSKAESGPKLLINGKTLKVPRNVWFVGTANHDETTQDFADKTYDRAHVMELPRHREEFEIKKQTTPSPYTYQALQDAFDKAKNSHREEAKKAYHFLEDKLGKILEDRFRVGWGNRLERQIESYLPVVIEAGGSTGEAADHIFATKILRKIRDRFDNRADDIKVLEEMLNASWSELDSKILPVRSQKILSDELRRLQGHIDEEEGLE